MTEYVILIVGDPDRWWTQMTKEERKHGYAEYGRFDEQLAERGHKVTGGAELHGSDRAKHLRPGATSPTDDPYAEGVEQVGGFCVVESADLADPLDCCSILTAIGEAVEVRPTVSADERP